MTRARDFIERLLERVGQRVFRADDEFALRHGWRATPRRLGLARTYRHAGFDRLASRPDCHGSGLLAEARCDRCSATGRVTLGQCVPTRR